MRNTKSQEATPQERDDDSVVNNIFRKETVMAKDRKPRTNPFEIDKKAIERLRKRLLAVKTWLTQDAVDKELNSAYFEKLGQDYNSTDACLDEVLKFLTMGDDPPEPIDD